MLNRGGRIGVRGLFLVVLLYKSFFQGGGVIPHTTPLLICARNDVGRLSMLRLLIKKFT